MSTETTTTESAPTADSTSSFTAKAVPTQRDDLVAAAKAVFDAEGVEQEGSPSNDTTGADASNDNGGNPTEPAEGEAGEPKRMSRVLQALSDRKEKQRQRADRESAIRESTQQLERERYEASQVRAQYQQEMKALAAERARLMEIRKDPFKAAEYAGIDHKTLAENLVMAGSPEWQESQRIRAELDSLKAQQAEQRAAWDQHQRALKEQREQAVQNEKASLELSFITHTSKNELYPTLSRLDDDHRLALGYSVAKKYYAATKLVASDQEIAEYLENSLKGTLAGDTRDERNENRALGNAPRNSRANGPRTLSNSVASERRTSPKPFSEFKTREERVRELAAAAKEAMKTGS